VLYLKQRIWEQARPNHWGNYRYCHQPTTARISSGSIYMERSAISLQRLSFLWSTRHWSAHCRPSRLIRLTWKTLRTVTELAKKWCGPVRTSVEYCTIFASLGQRTTRIAFRIHVHHSSIEVPRNLLRLKPGILAIISCQRRLTERKRWEY